MFLIVLPVLLTISSICFGSCPHEVSSEEERIANFERHQLYRWQHGLESDSDALFNSDREYWMRQSTDGASNTDKKVEKPSDSYTNHQLFLWQHGQESDLDYQFNQDPERWKNVPTE